MAHRALDADNRHPSRRQRRSWMTRHHEVGPEGCRRAAHVDTRPSSAKSDERSSTPLGRDCLAGLPLQRRRLVEGGNNRATRHSETGRNEVAKAAAGPHFPNPAEPRRDRRPLLKSVGPWFESRRAHTEKSLLERAPCLRPDFAPGRNRGVRSTPRIRCSVTPA